MTVVKKNVFTGLGNTKYTLTASIGIKEISSSQMLFNFEKAKDSTGFS